VVLFGAEAVAPLLRERFRLLAAPPADGPVAVIAQGAAAAEAIPLASDPKLVERLVLAEPDCPTEVLEQLADVSAPTLILWGTTDPRQDGELYQKRIPRAYLMYVYGQLSPEPFARLAADFIQRGDAFAVRI